MPSQTVDAFSLKGLDNPISCMRRLSHVALLRRRLWRLGMVLFTCGCLAWASLVWATNLHAPNPPATNHQAAMARQQIDGRVLVIHSYHAELPWTQQSKSGLDQGFQDSELEVQVFHEFLDLKRYPNASHEALFWEILHKKYDQANIDLLMVGDDPGLNLVLKHRKDFLPDVPIVFFGINRITPELLAQENMTGVFEAHSSLETILEAIRQTRSDGVILISDSSDTGVAGRAHVKGLRDAPGAPEKIVDIVDLVAENIPKVLGQYPVHWPVYMLGQLRQDRTNGPLIDTITETELLTRSIPNPVYSTSIEKLGKGIVGGKIFNVAFHKRKASELAEMVLRGIPMNQIEPVVKSQGQWVFDARQLKKHHISLANLPVNSEVLYQKRSWWEANRNWLWSMVIVVAVSGLVIVSLMFLVQRQRQISHQLRLKQRQLELAQKNLEDRVEQRTHELAMTKEKAEHANNAKSNFLASMSHELRTPLNAILGFSQLMEEDMDLSGEQKHTIGIINRSGEHLLLLINDILEMSKIEAGQTTLSTEDFDLHGLLSSVYEMLTPKAESKGLTLKFNFAENLPQYIHTDANKLRQVLINLLGNAIKFTQQGQVLLAASGGEDPYEVKFSVTDTGPGIISSEIDQLFNPFSQTAVGRKSRTGTGLGLSISKNFVELMAGQITVQSQPGQGSCFAFTIQTQSLVMADAVIEPTEKRQVTGLAPNCPVPKLLVVDDNPDNQHLLVQLVTSVGCQVKTADTGEAAIAICEDWQPDLVWMDIGLPQMDGCETTRYLKAQAKPPVVIAITAHTFEQEKAKALAAGCDDFVRKPFRTQEIWNKLAQHLNLTYTYERANRAVVSNLTQETALGPTQMRLQATLQATTVQEQLASTPPNWQQALSQAASSLRSEAVLQMLEDLPADQIELKQVLTQLVHDFRYDVILKMLAIASDTDPKD